MESVIILWTKGTDDIDSKDCMGSTIAEGLSGKMEDFLVLYTSLNLVILW